MTDDPGDRRDRDDATETGRFADGDRERLPEPLEQPAEDEGSGGATAIGGRLQGSTSRFGRTFSEGDEIAGRYRVVRFLAQGGMGEVYEVLDRELGERVALKTILPRIAANPVALERFRREILLARKVTHSNVCRIFDIGRHRLDGPDGEEITFLTMELLSGESLGRRLRRGPLTVDEALPLVRQTVAGLAAAHRAGVVHRDLKPANVFLVPGDGGVRAVVTDFGLARTEAAGEALKDMTGTGELLGTPSYMSPEQLEGRTPTPSSDIYALGLVLYEMLTGARAFEGDTAFQIALKRLQQPPTAPSKHLPDIDPLWERTILRCLEKDPSDRFQSVEQISAVLSGEQLSELSLPSRRVGRRAAALARRPVLWIPVAVVAVVLAGVALRQRPPTPGDQVSRTRRSVAVLGFENTTGAAGFEWISTALSEILTTELGVGGRLRTISGETVVQARNDLGITRLQSLAPESLARLRGYLGSDLLILGSYIVQGEELRVDVRVQDTTSGELVVQQRSSGASRELLRLAESLAGEILSGLGYAPGSGQARAAAMASLPSNPEAARLYSEGVDRLRAFDALAARDRLVEAAAADPESPLVYSALALAWGELGYEAEELSAAQRAVDLAQDLGRELETRIRGQYLMAARRWGDAITDFESLWTFFPDNLEYGLSLAESQVAAGRPDQALETIAELRALPAPDAEDPRIDLREAQALSAAGDFEMQLESGYRAVSRSEARGSLLQAATARLEVASALINLARYDEARATCAEALDFFGRTDNTRWVAVTHERLARVAFHQGDFAAAAAEAERALAVGTSLGNREIEANARNLLGVIQVESGEVAAATESFNQVLRIAQEIGSDELEALAFNNLALLHQRSGDLPRAIDMLRQVAAVERSRGNRNNEARALENIASAYATDGDLGTAKQYYEEAIGQYRELGSVDDLASALYWLGEVLLWQGELGDARRRYQEALELRRQAGQEADAALASFALAELALHEAHLGRTDYRAARDAIRDAARVFDELGWPADQAVAAVTLAEAEMACCGAPSARPLIERAEDLVRGVDDRASAVDLEILGARVSAADGDVEGAVRDLEALRAEAEAESDLGREFEVRLALGAVELAAGRADGRRRLETLREDANAHGWYLVAERAGRLLAGSP